MLLKENLDDITKFLQSEIFQAASKSTRPLFLFLDSLDQLLPLNNALLLNWLPLTLPPKVHLVVSTITDKKEGGLFDRVKDIFRYLPYPFLLLFSSPPLSSYCLYCSPTYLFLVVCSKIKHASQKTTSTKFHFWRCLKEKVF